MAALKCRARLVEACLWSITSGWKLLIRFVSPNVCGRVVIVALIVRAGDAS